MVRRAARILAGACVLALGCNLIQGQRVVVGSKNFTEQIILSELIAEHIETRTGREVDRRFNLGGTFICHDALRSGKIDLYVEYTGTALTAVLHEAPSKDREEVYQRVKAGYRERFGLEVTEPLGFNNSFALVVRGEDARRLRLKTISDIVSDAPRWRAGFGYEFMERPDGFQGLAKTYGLKFGEAPRIMELGLLYRALLEHQVDIVAGNATDGAIAANHLVILEDDRHYFPPYDAVPIVRKTTLGRFPDLRAALRELGNKISADDMRRMNYAVDGEHRDVRQVVTDFLRAKKL